MCQTRVQPETAPKDLLIASGIFEGSHRAVPVSPYLGASASTLKVRCASFETGSDCFQPIGVIIGSGGRNSGSSRRTAFVQLIGQQQRGEQQLAGFALPGHVAHRAQLGIDQSAQASDMGFLALGAGHGIIAATDRKGDITHGCAALMPGLRSWLRSADQRIKLVKRLGHGVAQLLMLAA